MWEYITGALTSPVKVFQAATANKMWRQGLLLVICVGMINGTANMALSGQIASILKEYATTSGLGFFTTMSELVKSPLFGFFSIPSLLNFWFAVGLIAFGIGKLFHSEGTLGGILGSLAFATSPYLIGSPLFAILSILGSGGQALGSIVSMFTIFWVMLLELLSLRESMKLSNVQVIVTYLLAMVGYLIWYVLLVSMLIILAYFINSI
jgi:hypothetical protein